MIEIPNYEIGKLAGRGGIAEVYIATHKLLDRTVAIKLISPSQSDDVADKRFLKEAKVVAGLRHPNIVSIYDVGIHESKYYIIMEFLEGGDLKQHIKRGLSVSQSIDIVKQIVSALAHAHDKGFIHRDIKSQNIMFRADGTAVLTDFGIVKDLAADTGYTVDGTSIGTPHYMSPEQAQGSAQVDWRTDIYSLGVTFYEMLTGELPYNADSAIAVALKHIKDPVPQLPAHLAQFQPIIDKSMAKSPDDRFQSLNDMLRTIYAAEGGDMPTQTIERSLLKQSRQNTKAKQIFAAAVIIAFLAGGLFLAKPYLRGFIDGQAPLDNGSADTSRQAGPLDADNERLTESPEPAKPLSAAPEAPEPSAEGETTTVSEPADATRTDSTPESRAANTQAIDAEFLKNTIVQKQYAEALNFIIDARKNTPAPDTELLKEADAFLEAGKWINAGDIYNTILSVEPNNTSAQLGLLYVAIEKQQDLETRTEPLVGEYEALLAILNKAIEYTDARNLKHLKVNTVETLYDAAVNQYQEGELAGADALAQTGLAYAPDHLRLKVLSYRTQARISYSEDRWTSPENHNAVAYYQKILQLDPTDADAKQGIDQIVSAFKASAIAAQESGSYNKALQQVQKARSIDPDRHDLKVAELLIFGDMHYAGQEYEVPENENARDYYRTVLSLAPENQKAKRRLAAIEVLGPIQDVKRASALVDKIPPYRTAFVNLAAVLAAYGNGTLATDLTKAVIDQIKTDIQHQKEQRQPIPPEFTEAVLNQFPELKKYISNAQYEILMTQGDGAPAKAKSAEFYLKALELDPSGQAAIQKIKAIAAQLHRAHNAQGAKSILKQAMAIQPNDPELKDMYQSLSRIESARAEISRLITSAKEASALQTKIDTYEALFTELESAIAGYGRSHLADLEQSVVTQIKSDVEQHKQKPEIIPPAFASLVQQHFSGLADYITEAQYDILMAKGESVASDLEKAGFYLEALRLHPDRTEVRDRMVDAVRQMDGNGQNREAVSTLKQAINVVPNHYEFLVLLQNVQRILEIFPTEAGCSRDHLISEAPVSLERISFCIQYMNLESDSIVNVLLSQENGASMEIPVVLGGRSGRKLINVDAPIEGFTVGTYSVAVKKEADILSETQIEFTPQRR